MRNLTLSDEILNYLKNIKKNKNKYINAYVGTALVGVRSIEHADENCKTFDWKLTEEEMKILDSKIEECAL